MAVNSLHFKLLSSQIRTPPINTSLFIVTTDQHHLSDYTFNSLTCHLLFETMQ